ncbi:MAG: bifunctional phosphopantothenoylcysteine decarboxylase/phosphopantothenate--cysteine ligase CoaBC [bacterium]|nr:bifunctional phosphopantothenoylcysteine decarboxylase/phosphopantothenate--cysteine ligase CoaBC [bacterium]
MKNKKILIGVSGGIAAYKACSLVNYCLKEGAEVRVMMTQAATKFVTPLTFQTLAGHEVYTDTFVHANPEEVMHISIAQWADVLVIAPATANIIGKIASGIADDLLSTVALALPGTKKIALAPAMNVEMWNNSIVRKNIEFLENEGGRYIFVEPRSGVLACRDTGEGKIAKNDQIIDTVKNIVSE